MSAERFRRERDSLGEVEVPVDALYGAQTQRAIENFPISGLVMPRSFIRALGMVKAAAARVNGELGLLDAELAGALQDAAEQVVAGRLDAHFPVDVFQTGSGTSSNMNANEAIARLAALRLGRPVHPNDDVNMCQSSNDVVPTAIHLAAALQVTEDLQPALAHLADAIGARAAELAEVPMTGRTHLMDAVPLTFGQALGAWETQMRIGRRRIAAALERVCELPIGGTAVGTGLNAHPDFGARVTARLAEVTGLPLRPKEDRFEGLSAQDAAVELSGQLRTVAVGMMKIANDLRWLNSGPLAGLGEISLPALQPGSSIMPGKVNPVVPEAVCMVCAQVIGNDVTVTVAGQSGNFQLNVMLPVIAYNLSQSLQLLAASARLLADRAVSGFRVNRERIEASLARNPVLVTALNPVIGYELGAEIAKRAYAEGRPVKDLARELTGLDEAELDRLLDPLALTRGGIRG